MKEIYLASLGSLLECMCDMLKEIKEEEKRAAAINSSMNSLQLSESQGSLKFMSCYALCLSQILPKAFWPFILLPFPHSSLD